MRNAVIAIAGLFGLLLPACGGDGNESPPPAPGAEPKGTDRISIFRNAYDPAADLPRIEPEHAVIYMPSGNWSYSHHPSVTYFQGAFYAVYSNGMRGEDEPGQRMMIASSRDFIRWSAPQLLAEPSDGDYGTKKILTPGGIRVCDGRLTVYYTENDNDGTSNARLNPQLYAVTSPDGRTWTRPVSLGLAIFPSHAPLRLSTGRLAMTCNRAFYYSDDPTGLRGWHKCGTAAQDQTGHVTFEQIRPSLWEGELFEHADGTLYCLFRNSSTPYDGYLWQAQSYDGGRNWTMPVRSDFSDNNTKSFFCALPDGRYLYIGTPDNTRQGTRYPLVLALSEDGFNYDKCYILSDDRYTRQYEGRWKSGDYGYPFAYIREGWIYVIVSRQKERMDALKCKISDLR